jgi:hypothetical protein
MKKRQAKKYLKALGPIIRRNPDHIEKYNEYIETFLYVKFGAKALKAYEYFYYRNRRNG